MEGKRCAGAPRCLQWEKIQHSHLLNPPISLEPASTHLSRTAHSHLLHEGFPAISQLFQHCFLPFLWSAEKWLIARPISLTGLCAFCGLSPILSVVMREKKTEVDRGGNRITRGLRACLPDKNSPWFSHRMGLRRKASTGFCGWEKHGFSWACDLEVSKESPGKLWAVGLYSGITWPGQAKTPEGTLQHLPHQHKDRESTKRSGGWRSLGISKPRQLGFKGRGHCRFYLQLWANTSQNQGRRSRMLDFRPLRFASWSVLGKLSKLNQDKRF